MEKILFVDNYLALLDLLNEEFTDEGYEVIVAHNGKAALRKYRENAPHLVVMDPHLPDMDEKELLNSFLSFESHAPIVIYEAYPQREDFQTPMVEGSIIKSSDFSQLKSKVREILQTP